MTTTPMVQAAAHPQRHATNAYPAGGRIFDLVASLLSLWMIAGLYLDGSAHHHVPDLIDTFFTPWHAVLYSGFLANALLLLITQWRNLWRGYAWQRALPRGYTLSLWGAGVFMVSGVADILWHEAFGFEVGLEALVSPSHLTLAVGGMLLITGPLRASLQRQAGAASHSGSSTLDWRDHLPVVLALLAVLSVLTFFTGDFAILTYPHLMVIRPSGGNTFFQDMHGLASTLIPATMLMGTLLFAIQRWTLPVGGLALIILGNGLLMVGFHLREVYFYPQTQLAVVVASVVAEALYHGLKPSAARPLALRVFAFIVPMSLFGALFAILIATAGVWWTIHLWAGAVFLAGVTGLLLSYLIVPAKA